MSTEALRQVWLFAGFDESQLENLLSFTFEKTYSPGDMIMEEGETGNGMYVIISGNVEVLKALGTEQQRVVATRGSGDVFGEMALLGEWPRTASVRALDEVECLGMDRWVFLSQLEQDPQVGIRMLQILAQRLRESDARLAE